MDQRQENGSSKNTVIAVDENKSNRNECVDIDKVVKKSDTPFLYFTVFMAMLLLLTGGTSLVWQSPAVTKLKSNDTQTNPLGRPIETIEISMLVGIPQFTSIIGGVFIPKLADVIGRKKALHLIGLALLICLLGTAFSKTIYLYIIFISIIGNIFSGIWGLLPMYITEISEDHNRVKFCCLLALCLPLGQLYCYVVGSQYSIRDFTLLTTIPLIPFLMLFFFVPESPVYLITKGKKEESDESFQKLRSNKSEMEIEQEFQKINDGVVDAEYVNSKWSDTFIKTKKGGIEYSLSKRNKEKCVEALRKLRSNKTKKEIEKDFQKINDGVVDIEYVNSKWITLFKTKEGRVGLFLALLPLLVHYLSGVPIVMILMSPIFNETGTLPGNTVAMIVGSIKVLSYFFTSQVVERSGRKPLLLISSVGAGISVTILGGFFYLKYINSPLVEHLKWLPLVACTVYIISYALGLGPLPITVVSELFPSDLRSAAVGCVSFVGTIIFSILSFSFPLLAASLGTHWCMWLFGFNCFVGALLIYFVMPETKGKSIVEIQKMLREY